MAAFFSPVPHCTMPFLFTCVTVEMCWRNNLPTLGSFLTLRWTWPHLPFDFFPFIFYGDWLPIQQQITYQVSASVWSHVAILLPFCYPYLREPCCSTLGVHCGGFLHSSMQALLVVPCWRISTSQCWAWSPALQPGMSFLWDFLPSAQRPYHQGHPSSLSQWYKLHIPPYFRKI